MNRRSPARMATSLALLFGTAVVAVAPGTDAAPVKKQFTVGLAITDGAQQAVSSAALQANTSYTFVFTVTNTSKGPQYYGSMKILVPTGYAATPQSATNASGFTASSVTGGILVTSPTGSGIAPAAAVVVTAAVTTPSSSCSAEWTTLVKQSNDFLGTGNDFIISGAQPTTTVGTPYLSWAAQQPSATEYDVAMSPAPIVTALDPCGHPVTSGVPVTLTDEAGKFSTTATKSGTTSTSNGQAAFSNLTFADFGFYDRMTATASGFTSAVSNWFIVAEKVTSCTTTTSCSLDLGNKNTTLATVTTGSGAAGQYVSGSRLAGTSGSNNFADCTTQEGGNLQVSDTMIIDTPRAKEVTLTIAKALVNAVSNNGTPFMDICLDIPALARTPDNAFLTKADVASGITDPALATAYTGLLPDCAAIANTPPCVVSRGKRAANEVIVFDLPAGDPRIGAY